MCGICGVAGESSEALLRRMTRRLVHRGPDDEGVYVADGVGLGVRRVSIIDLAGGHQPMSNDDAYPRRLARRIEQIRVGDLAADVGQRNRAVAERLFDYDVLAERLCGLLDRVLRRDGEYDHRCKRLARKVDERLRCEAQADSLPSAVSTADATVTRWRYSKGSAARACSRSAAEMAGFSER